MRPRSLIILSALICGAVGAAGMFIPAATAAAEVQFESASPLSNKDCGKAETAIGDLFTDAIRSAARADIALMACSELRPKDEAFPAGKMSSSQLAGLVTYPNDPIVLMELPGRVVRAGLERSVALYPQTNMGFLQVSGLRYTFDRTKPIGQRVASITVGSSALSDDTRYRVAVTSSMANGALGYWKVWSARDIVTKLPDSNVIAALETYLAGNPRIDYAKAGRITDSAK